MRALAEFIMRGRSQATLVVGLAAAMPMMFCISAAGSSLVLMRKGAAQSFSVVVWALIPATFWAWYGDPYVLLVIAGSLVMAHVLRESTSWLRVLLCNILIGVAAAAVLSATFGSELASWSQTLAEAMPTVFAELWEQLGAEEQAKLHALLPPVLTGLMAAVAQLMALLSVLLARYWQATLYNPGGFGQDFRAIRLPAVLAAVLVMLMLLAPRFHTDAAVLMPLCAIPLGIAGLALVHGLANRYRMGRLPLVVFYVGLFLFSQLLFPLLVLLALADSVFDFRGLRALSKREPESTDNGE